MMTQHLPRAAGASLCLFTILLPGLGCSDGEGRDTSGTGGSAGSGGAVSAGASSAGGAAGGPSAGAEMFLPLYENGTRLRAVSLGETGSDARLLLAWYDSELEAECQFLLAEDNEYRCLPLARPLSAGFADADCTIPIWYDGLIEPCSSSPPFRVEALSSELCAGSRVFRLSEQTLASVYHESCGEALTLPDGAVVLGEPQPMNAADFVRADRRERSNDEGFGVVELVADDGARQVLSIFDEEFGACSAREVAGGGVRCIPHHANLDAEWFFADSACTSDALSYAIPTEDCVASEPVMALEFNRDQVGAPPGLLAIGPAVEGTIYERSYDGLTCTGKEAGEVIWTLHPLEGPFDATRLLSPTPEARGSERLRVWHHAVGGTFLSAQAALNGAPQFFDATKAEPCQAVRSAGGGWACLAAAVLQQGELYYADTACSEPLAIAPADDTVIVATSRFNHCVREAWTSFAEETIEVYAVGEAHGGAVYQSSEGSCAVYEPTTAQSFVRLEPISAEDSPALAETTE